MLARLSGVRTPSDVDRAAWATLERRGRELFGPVQEEAFKTGGLKLSLRKAGTDPIGQAAKAYAAAAGAKKIVEVLGEVRDSINAVIVLGLDNGWGVDKVGRRLRPVVGLNSRQTAAASNLYTSLLEQGVEDEASWARVERYAMKLQRQRAEMIARTETNDALREGIIEAARQHEVELLDRVGDPQCCEICAELNAAGPYTPAEAAEEDVANPHPNCECTFVIHAGGGA
jgi:hypothetical protein